MRRIMVFVVALGLTLIPVGSAHGQKGGHPGSRLEGVSVPPGYFVKKLATGLNFPTGIALGDRRIWVSEAGEPAGVPRVVQVGRDGSVTPVLAAGMLEDGALLPPLIDITHHQGWLWITHRQVGVNGWHVGAISKFRPSDPTGTFETVITDLPASGDHHTNEIVFGKDGRAYFAQGSATNTSVVGLDNLLITGWLDSFPDFRDFPAKDIALSGIEFTTINPLTADPDDTATTAPFMPFASGPVDEGTVVQGASPATPQDGIIAGNGTAYSFDPTAADPASTLRLETWGLRNPFGIGLDPFSPRTLFVSNNGSDVRTARGPELPGLPETEPDELVPVGSRPVENDWDDLFKVKVGGAEEFVGWPDYFHDPQTGDVLPITDPLFCQSPLLPPTCSHDFALAESFRDDLTVERAFAQFDNHSSANKFGFSTSKKFKHRGDLFVAETGSFVPITGAQQFTGYKVVRVDRDTGRVSDFIVNEGDSVEELFDPESFNKPIDVKFAARGRIMLVVDFGVFEPGVGVMQPNTGKVWLVSRRKAPLEFNEKLTGYEEVPALSTPGKGKFRLQIHRGRDEISYRLRYAHLEGEVQQAHIHLGQRAVNGGISVFLCTNLGNGPAGTQACPPAPATIDGTIRPADVIGPADQGIDPGEFDELVRAIRAGATYVNVHSTEYPAGEIRAQLEKPAKRGHFKKRGSAGR